MGIVHPASKVCFHKNKQYLKCEEKSDVYMQWGNLFKRSRSNWFAVAAYDFCALNVWSE